MCAYIEYFDRLDMRRICRQISLSASEDYYDAIVRNHPVAWKALMKMGNSAAAVITYPKVEGSESTASLETLFDARQRPLEDITEGVQDGYDPKIQGDLLNALMALKDDQIEVLYYDSFKMLTRNFEKLMRVLDYVLSIGKPFVTCNYYISNGYIERRASLVKPAHSLKEMGEKLALVNGTGKKHRVVLGWVRELDW